MMHQIRQTMGKRDSLYLLGGIIEFDEGYFKTEISEKGKQNLKRSKKRQQKVNVAVMAKSTSLENFETGKTDKQCRYFKVKVPEGHQSININQIVQRNIDEKSSTIIGIREGCRIEGDYILSVDKLRAGKSFEDGVVMAVNQKPKARNLDYTEIKKEILNKGAKLDVKKQIYPIHG